MPQQTATPPRMAENLHEVRATFGNTEALNEAVAQLSMAGFDRADLALPERPGAADTDLSAPAVTTESDATGVRTLATSLAAAAGAMLGGGIAVATGGAAVVAVAAAVAAGGGIGAVTNFVATGAKNADEADLEHKAATGDLVLAVRAATAEKRDLAETIARAAGAHEIVAT